jgi:hypothetical protein
MKFKNKMISKKYGVLLNLKYNLGCSQEKILKNKTTMN